MKINTSKIIFILRLVIAGFNLLAFACTVTLLIHPMHYLLFNLFGYAVLLTLFLNIVSAYLNTQYRYLDYGYLFLHIISMLLIPVLNTLAASDVQNKTSQSVFVFIIFIIIFLFGTIITILQLKDYILKQKSDAAENTQKTPGIFKNVLRWISVVLICVNLFVGFYAAHIMLGFKKGDFNEVFISEFAVFWGLSMLASSVLIVKLLQRNKKSVIRGFSKTSVFGKATLDLFEKVGFRPLFQEQFPKLTEFWKLLINKIILTAGILICAVFMLPLFSIPSTIKGADKAFRDAFGNTYLDDKTSVMQNGFMRSRFSLQDYFFGKRTQNYNVKENVLYYEGDSGVDDGIKLHFDVYTPLNNESKINNQNPVLIRIHGGAWTMGDKGFSNYSAENKHFVNLGYVVFDIQYGINDRNPSFGTAAVPASVKGNFDIDDMVCHIGLFTSFLADNADEYGANIDSVFISGASAGGQLANAAALGITSGRYTDILDPRLNIKGLIPFYPANGLSPKVGIGGTQDLVDPSEMVDNNSPPCLIYHGTHDGVVPPIIAAAFKKTYDENSSAPCALIWMKFSGHGSDFYTPGYFNQIFMYYMERFMYGVRIIK